jgi:DNA-nicking Smr family endonuclease
MSVAPEDADGEDDDVPEVVELEITGELDLHHFRPEEVAELVPDYLAAAAERGLVDLRIVHGKGRGTLRRIVHAALERSDLVESFTPDPGRGGWGATVVRLKRPA